MSIKGRIYCPTLLFIANFVFINVIHADMDHQHHGSDDNNVIIGAGAHFAWAVFAPMKQELEQLSGRPLELFGEGSLLGVGCNAGIKTALQNKPGRETFGFTCCPLADEEIREKELIVHPIAKEPILIMVNEKNPVSELTNEQIRAIFRGDITNWRELGGVDKSIVVVSRLHCAKRPGHWKTILPGKEHFRNDRLNVTSAEEMLENINALEFAIGHIGSAWMFKPTDKIKVIRVDGIEPTAKNLEEGRYPYYRQLSAVTDKNPSKEVISIIKYVQTSESMHKVAEKFELLPFSRR